ncbi:SDR family NAD(P)-dependent oxidoreductase [bacterium]|nr:SDR family NAD(P)-dependent oxidoreductase [bacterium]
MNKVVFITGASSGIGEALALEYASRGATVALTARRVERLNALAQSIQKQGGRALSLSADVTREASLDAAVQATLRAFGRIDVVIANAGFGVAGSLEKLSNEDYRRQFETNVFGVLNTVRSSLVALKESRGQLAIMGSVAGYVASAGATPYAMSKFAVRALADGLRSELHSSGVGVTLISPGFVSSEIRLLNNRGERKSDADPIPSWLCMSAPKAAAQIASAITRRQAEAVITRHGQLLVFLARHFPGLLRLLGKRVRRHQDKGFSLKG